MKQDVHLAFLRQYGVLRSASLAAALLIMLPHFLAAQQAAKRKRMIHRVQYGIASWYGRESQGHLMACGEPFDDHQMVAATRTLPLGTRVKVTNLRNGRSVTVSIKDRGPAVTSRLIDLSREAARRLGYTGRGLTPVRVRVLSVPPKAQEKVMITDAHSKQPIERGAG